MLALYRCGRHAEALAASRAAREMLVAELGVDPAAADHGHQLRVSAGYQSRFRPCCHADLPMAQHSAVPVWEGHTHAQLRNAEADICTPVVLASGGLRLGRGRRALRGGGPARGDILPTLTSFHLSATSVDVTTGGRAHQRDDVGE